MAVVYASKNAGGVARATTGWFTSDNTITEVILGYRPKAVKVVNVTDVIVNEKIEGMADNACINTVTAGTTTINTTGLITFQDNGFTLSVAAVGDDKSIVWEAT